MLIWTCRHLLSPETHHEFYFLPKSQFEAGKQSFIVANLPGTTQPEVKSHKTMCNNSKVKVLILSVSDLGIGISKLEQDEY